MSYGRIMLWGVAVLTTVAVVFQGCGSYSEVNALTFAHAKALYAACNSQQPKRLETCAAMIMEAQSAQQISNKEAGYLQDIISVGQAGNWEDAQAMARQLMSDQADR